MNKFMKFVIAVIALSVMIAFFALFFGGIIHLYNRPVLDTNDYILGFLISFFGLIVTAKLIDSVE